MIDDDGGMVGLVPVVVYGGYDRVGDNDADDDDKDMAVLRNRFAYIYSAIFLPPDTDGSTRAT